MLEGRVGEAEREAADYRGKLVVAEEYIEQQDRVRQDAEGRLAVVS